MTHRVQCSGIIMLIESCREIVHSIFNDLHTEILKDHAHVLVWQCGGMVCAGMRRTASVALCDSSSSRTGLNRAF